MPITTDQKADALGRLPLFAGISSESMARLAEVAGEQQFEAGDYIVRQGQVGTGLYVILDGEASVIRGSTEIGRLGAGDFFGELAVIDQMPRSASVRAETAARCLAVASWDLLALLDDDRALSRNLITGLVARLRSVSDSHRH
ncbi:MAG TPA: cyclic nucleotide-binding domain-containing protein [Candidatus Limnocylindrales bacterium]